MPPHRHARAVSRARAARSRRALGHTELQAAGQIGVPGRGVQPPGTSASTANGFIRLLRQLRRRGCNLERDRATRGAGPWCPAVTTARSCSIFIRPPPVSERSRRGGLVRASGGQCAPAVQPLDDARQGRPGPLDSPPGLWPHAPCPKPCGVVCAAVAGLRVPCPCRRVSMSSRPPASLQALCRTTRADWPSRPPRPLPGRMPRPSSAPRAPAPVLRPDADRDAASPAAWLWRCPPARAASRTACGRRSLPDPLAAHVDHDSPPSERIESNSAQRRSMATVMPAPSSTNRCILLHSGAQLARASEIACRARRRALRIAVGDHGRVDVVPPNHFLQRAVCSASASPCAPCSRVATGHRAWASRQGGARPLVPRRARPPVAASARGAMAIPATMSVYPAHAVRPQHASEHRHVGCDRQHSEGCFYCRSTQLTPPLHDPSPAVVLATLERARRPSSTSRRHPHRA